jgi:hypothetical protein
VDKNMHKLSISNPQLDMGQKSMRMGGNIFGNNKKRRQKYHRNG